MTNPQLATGPQKCVVLGPVGLLTKLLSLDPRPTLLEAMTAKDHWVTHEGRCGVRVQSYYSMKPPCRGMLPGFASLERDASVDPDPRSFRSP